LWEIYNKHELKHINPSPCQMRQQNMVYIYVHSTQTKCPIVPTIPDACDTVASHSWVKSIYLKRFAAIRPSIHQPSIADQQGHDTARLRLSGFPSKNPRSL
jgi:hypothetical protein